MKKIFYLFAILLISLNINAQEEDADTTRINVGNKEVIIIDNGGDLEIQTNNDTILDWDDDCDEDRLTYWGGVDIGINIWMDPDGNTNFEGDDVWLDQNYGRSFSWDLNLVEKKIRIVDDYVGLITGLGVSYKSYGLADSVIVQNKFNTVNSEGAPITIDSTNAIFATDEFTFSKNKFRTSALKVPLLLEFNTSKDEDRNFHVAAGVLGGWNFSTMTKRKYELDGDKYKDRSKGNYNVRDFTLDAHVRVGFRDFTVFATYGLTPFFEDDKGPEIYSATVGIALIPF